MESWSGQYMQERLTQTKQAKWQLCIALQACKSADRAAWATVLACILLLSSHLSPAAGARARAAVLELALT